MTSLADYGIYIQGADDLVISGTIVTGTYANPAIYAPSGVMARAIFDAVVASSWDLNQQQSLSVRSCNMPLMAFADLPTSPNVGEHARHHRLQFLHNGSHRCGRRDQ